MPLAVITSDDELRKARDALRAAAVRERSNDRIASIAIIIAQLEIMLDNSMSTSKK